MANQILLIFSNGINDLKSLGTKQRVKFLIGIIAFLVITVGLSYSVKLLFARIHLPALDVAWVTYLIVMITFLVSNLVPFGPAPISLTILFTAVTIWNPLPIGFAAAIGASLGGLGGYVAGALGRKALLKENFMCSFSEVMCNKSLINWVERKGPLVIGILAVQPILPFEIVGIIAGSLSMPVRKFFGATLVGNTIKYVLLASLAGVITSIPFMK